MVIVGMEKISDEVLAKLYRDRRDMGLAYFDELTRRGYRVTWNGADVVHRGNTCDLRITKTEVKEL